MIRATARLWRKHHLDYDRTKYVVEQVRRRLGRAAPATRPRTVERLDRAEVERLIAAAYRDNSLRGLMIKTLFLTGARVSEFVHIRVEDLHLDDDPPRIHLAHAKGQTNRHVPILPALAQELRTHLQGRRQGSLVREQPPDSLRRADGADPGPAVCPRGGHHPAGPPPFLRHSIATMLLDSGQVPIDQVRKFLVHLHLSTTQIYAETSLRALGENYVRALGGQS